jgi:hypothetical protein
VDQDVVEVDITGLDAAGQADNFRAGAQDGHEL